MIVFCEQLGPGQLFACAQCGTHLTRVELLESTQFKGKTGPALLMTKVWNYRCGPAEERQLLTGEHTIQEIYCVRCESNVGWTYLRAYEQSQQYKVGKFILETGLITKLSVKRGNPFKADRDAAPGKPRSGSRAHSAAPPPEPMETTGSA